MTVAREIHLVSRPLGMPGPENFRLVETELPALTEGQVLVANRYLSVDPYMRGRMRENAVYAAAYELNKVMYGGAVGEVVETRSPLLQTGDIVLSQCAWRDRFVADAGTVSRIEPVDRNHLSWYLGTLGMPGMTAYVGLLKFGEPKQGDTVFVSAASGAVGANVCQIARLKGCHVVGSVGSEAKAAWLRDECQVPDVINYRRCDDLSRALAEAAPDGVDVYFENVGGDHLQAALANMNPFGRIVACGMIQTYNNAEPAPGPSNLMLIVGRKLRIQGFIVSDHMELQARFRSDMEAWIGEGRIKIRETVVDGLDNTVDAFLGLFSGENFGKMVVRV